MFTVVEASQKSGDLGCGHSRVGTCRGFGGAWEEARFPGLYICAEGSRRSKGEVGSSSVCEPSRRLHISSRQQEISEANSNDCNLYLPGLQHPSTVPSLAAQASVLARGAFDRSHPKQVLCVSRLVDRQAICRNTIVIRQGCLFYLACRQASFQARSVRRTNPQVNRWCHFL